MRSRWPPTDILFAIANKAFWPIATGVPFPAGDAVYVDTLTVYFTEMFRVHRPDVTLMDLRMPIMNGIDAIKAIPL